MKPLSPLPLSIYHVVRIDHFSTDEFFPLMFVLVQPLCLQEVQSSPIGDVVNPLPGWSLPFSFGFHDDV